jgi:SAM-dependent methyltransferase
VDDRRRLLLRGIDASTSLGLELGPLANPVVTRDMGRVRYLDHVDTAALRSRYATHDGFDIEAIVAIDHVIGEGTIVAAVGDAAPFDYIVASHVIEHVPDLVRWLDDIHSVLRPGGLVALAVPDHRRCFDALRSPSVAADIVAAHLTGATVPNARQVYDHYAGAVAWHGHIAWNEEPVFAELVPVHSEDEALARARAVVTTGDYDDVHCWVFTPRSFTTVFEALQRRGLLRFEIDRVSDTVGGEFFVSLRAVDSPTRAERTPLEQRASETARVRAELAAAERDLAAVRAERDAILASRSWRVAGVLRRANTLGRRVLAKLRPKRSAG